MSDPDTDLDPEQGEEGDTVPADLLELFEVLEWEEATRA